jgi:hypothetical protein
MEIIGKKYFVKIQEKIPSMLLDINFLKEYRFYSYAGWEHFLAQIFSKLLLGQCGHGHGHMNRHGYGQGSGHGHGHRTYVSHVTKISVTHHYKQSITTFSDYFYVIPVFLSEFHFVRGIPRKSNSRKF